MIKSILEYLSVKEKRKGKIEIDLTGQEGNAFVLLGYAKKWAKQLGKDPEAITKRMMEGNYERLLEVLEEEFGDFIILYR